MSQRGRISLPLVVMTALASACVVDKGTDSTPSLVDEDGDGVAAEDDCDDSLAWVYPGAAEVCDGIDNDCDGEIDEDLARIFYTDADGDGYGAADSTIEACEQPSDAVIDDSDCDDDDGLTHPGAAEICDEIDNDCDTLIDEDAKSSFYTDGDGDGYGDPSTESESCEPASDQVENASDCDDTNSEIHPGALELCDEIDNDCDDLIDDQDEVDDPSASTWYADADDDNWGDPDSSRLLCEEAEGYVDNAEDCDDSTRMVKPDGLEICDGIDNDCDELIDDADESLDVGTASEVFPDADGDGWGAEDSPVYRCDTGSGYVTREGDCDDSDDTVHIMADEVCDELDNDCDGEIDNDCEDEEEEEEEEEPTGEWTSWSGYEGFAFSEGSSFGDRACELYWEAAGELSSAAVTAGCIDCEFVFDLEMTYDSSVSTDDGTCAKLATDMSYTYGYIGDYYGYGSYLMYYSSYYGTFSAWAEASLDDSTGDFEYSYGYEDWDYYGTGTYYTYLWAGEAELSE